jgi:putative NADPH-quinone reductase
MRIVVIQGHPDRAPERLCRALGGAYVEAARQAGHEVAVLDLASVEFPLLASQKEFGSGSIPPPLVEIVQAIRESDHLVVIFPLWLGTMPALVKAFLEQAMRPGVAFAYRSGGSFPRKLMSGKSARLVVTMGMPALLYRWWYGGFGVRGMERNILNFVGFRPVRTSLFGMVDTASASRRKAWLDEMGALGRQGR